MFEESVRRKEIKTENLNIRINEEVNNRLDYFAGLLNLTKSDVTRILIYNSIDLFEEQQKTNRI